MYMDPAWSRCPCVIDPYYECWLTPKSLRSFSVFVQQSSVDADSDGSEYGMDCLQIYVGDVLEQWQITPQDGLSVDSVGVCHQHALQQSTVKLL